MHSNHQSVVYTLPPTSEECGYIIIICCEVDVINLLLLGIKLRIFLGTYSYIWTISCFDVNEHQSIYETISDVDQESLKMKKDDVFGYDEKYISFLIIDEAWIVANINYINT